MLTGTLLIHDLICLFVLLQIFRIFRKFRIFSIFRMTRFFSYRDLDESEFEFSIRFGKDPEKAKEYFTKVKENSVFVILKALSLQMNKICICFLLLHYIILKFSLFLQKLKLKQSKLILASEN